MIKLTHLPGLQAQVLFIYGNTLQNKIKNIKAASESVLNYIHFYAEAVIQQLKSKYDS